MSARMTRIADAIHAAPSTARAMALQLNLATIVVCRELKFLSRLRTIHISGWTMEGSALVPVYQFGHGEDAPKPTAAAIPANPGPRHIRHSSDGVISPVEGFQPPPVPRTNWLGL